MYHWFRLLGLVFVVWICGLVIVYAVPTFFHAKDQEIIVSMFKWQQSRDTTVSFLFGLGFCALTGIFLLWFYYDEEANKKQRKDKLRQIIKEEMEKKQSNV